MAVFSGHPFFIVIIIILYEKAKVKRKKEGVNIDLNNFITIFIIFLMCGKIVAS